MNTEKVTRLEIIDHTPCDTCKGQRFVQGEVCKECQGLGAAGREVVFWNKDKQVEVQLQDDDKTLKIFISTRGRDADM